MTIEKSKRSAFEAVCELASRERWCWEMACGTCGHLYFRCALLELSDGMRPDVDGWITRESRHHRVRRIPGATSYPFSFSDDRQRALSSILADASLRRIASVAKFPDWLGYVGLALRYTEEAERCGRRLTKAWVPQLQALCIPDSGAVERLQSVLDNESGILRWHDLESVEWAIGDPRLQASIFDGD